MSLTIDQSKTNKINPGLPLVFIDSPYFRNG